MMGKERLNCIIVRMKDLVNLLGYIGILKLIMQKLEDYFVFLQGFDLYLLFEKE